MLNDNGSQSLSREFKIFANEWFFEHVASSLYHPIAWLRILSNLLCKGTRNGSGPWIGLLNLRNVPKDQTLGSPARRLMSSCTSLTIPAANQLLIPKAASALNVPSAYDNRHVKHLAVFIHNSLWDFKLRKVMRKVALLRKQLQSQADRTNSTGGPWRRVQWVLREIWSPARNRVGSLVLLVIR